MPAALTVTNLSKTFGGQRALDGVSLEVAPGEIRALVGQNGCGKSTLIKILAGFHEPDEGGAVDVDGQELKFGSGTVSEAAGLRFVHQDLGLVGTLDTVDNLALGQGYTLGRFHNINWRSERKLARKALTDLGYELDVRRLVGTLAMSERTAVAIARALSPRGSDAKLLVLDEPTANLPAAEAARLYALVRSVSRSGVAVLFVSHHFDEVFELADTVTVLRDGRLVETRPVEGLTEPDLVELVIGRQLGDQEHEAIAHDQGEVVLQADAVNGNVVTDLTFQIRAGEVVGIAGITGSGREEIAGLIFGGAGRTGEVRINGTALPPQRPDLAIDQGIGLVPAERHANAAFLTSSLRENITLVDPTRNFVKGFMRTGREKSDVNTWLTRLDVRPNRSEFTLNALSGGNQQKVILARWLRQEPKVLILDEPTQGVDVGAKSDIHTLVDEAAAQGTAVLVLSTDHEELVRLCHRVLVMRNGKVVEDLRPPSLNTDRLTAATIGRSQNNNAA